MPERRGVMLIVVLVVVVVTALVGVGALDAGRAVASSARTEADRTGARTVANAGVRAVAEQLLEQRDALLRGEDPELDDRLELWGDADNGAFAELLPVGPEGELWVSEAAKLDLNRVDAQALAKLPLLDERTANAIVGARPADGFRAVGDLLTVEGVTPLMLFGDDFDTPWDTLDATPRDPALCDYLSVLSAEPNTSVGLGFGGEDNEGQQRFNLNRPWSERVREEVLERYDGEIARAVQFGMDSTDLSDDEAFCSLLALLDAPTEEIAGIFDAFTTSPDPFLIGRTDATRAPAAVLACLPGFDEETAGAVVDRRTSLGAESLVSPLWIVGEDLMTLEAFAPAAPWLSARSLQWRVLLRTGVTTGAEDDQGRPVVERVRITELVIDVAAPRPRLAYMADLTDRPLLARLYRQADTGDAEPFPMALVEDEPMEASPDENPRPRGLNLRDRRREREEPEPSTTGIPMMSPEPEAPEGVDRRSGRWTTGAPAGQTAQEEPDP